MDVVDFLKALLADWVGLVSGLFSIVLTIAGFLIPAANQKKWFLGVAGLCFLLAAMRVWTIEHRARVFAEDESHPHLALTLDSTMIGSMTNQSSPRSKFTTIAVTAYIVNTGAPSTFSIEAANLIYPNGRKDGLLVVARSDKDTVLNGAPGQPTFVLDRFQALASKQMGAPLTKGGGVSGWLMYVLPGADSDAIRAMNPTVQIEIKDINGVSVIATRKLVTTGMDGLYNPLGDEKQRPLMSP